MSLLVKVHQILSLTVSGSRKILNLLVYDTTGSIELRVEGVCDDVRPGHTVLSLENVACLNEPDSGKMHIAVPKRSKYTKVHVYNEEDEINSFGCEIEQEEMAEIVGIKNRSRYNFTIMY